ncbi:MAG: hypothetical protein HY606_13115, partial [Planctomycetes bacterium]|nr:hypothetical protein [Planctomycetota bacterium]
MIRLSFNREEEIIITQQDSPPSIYLDNWALRHISEDGSLAQRFINCLKSRNGTLYISQMNLLEFSRVRDQRHVVEIETFLESISPQLFFIDVIPKNVIDRENIIIENNVAKEAPHNDFALARCFITRNHPT